MQEPWSPEKAIRPASQRLVRTVDALEDEAWSGPSLLPGWSRAHVVAHLALNAEALAGVLRGVEEGRAVPMYASQESRDADIAELAADSPATLRERLLSGITDFYLVLAALPPDRADVEVERVPGGPTFRADAVAGLRLREVEVHHADLDCGYSHHDWTKDFAASVLDHRSRAARPSTGGCTVYAVDLDRRWTFGDPSAGPTIRGRVTALAWWAAGRKVEDTLESDTGAIPEVSAW